MDADPPTHVPQPRLALIEAAREWCDPQVLTNLNSAFEGLRRAVGPLGIDGHAFISKLTTFSLLTVIARPDQVKSASAIHRAALKALETDFCLRVSRGELRLWGVRQEPTLDRHATHIAPGWADGLAIEWPSNSVRIGKHQFAGVICELVSTPARSTRRHELTKPKSAGGRPTFPFEQFVDIARSRLRQRQPSNKQESFQLLEEYQARHADKPPAQSTILRKVSEIYRRAGAKEI